MSYENWMSGLPDEISKNPLNLLKIPGSHDSFTYNIKINAEIGPDVRPSALKLFKVGGNKAKNFMRKWLITQNLNITQQLIAGIRYFDIRVGRTSTDEFCITHQLFADNLYHILDDLNEFLKLHPKEVVLLDFNHVYINDEDDETLQNYLINLLRSKLVNFTQYKQKSSLPTLQDIWNRNEQVLIFYQHSARHATSPLWPNDVIPTFWPNTTDIGFMESFLTESLSAKAFDKFHISQAILTPSASTITWHPFTDLHCLLANQAGPSLIKWIHHLSPENINKINVIIADFVQENDIISTIIQLNFSDKKENEI